MTDAELQDALDALGAALPDDPHDMLEVLATATGPLLVATAADRPAFFQRIETIAANAEVQPSGEVQ